MSSSEEFASHVLGPHGKAAAAVALYISYASHYHHLDEALGIGQAARLGWHSCGAMAPRSFRSGLLAQRSATPLPIFSKTLVISLILARLAGAGYDRLSTTGRSLAVVLGSLALAYFTRLALMRDPVTYTAYLRKNRRWQQAKVDVPRVCVVGAGFSGLGACGALARWNIDYDCYEADDQVGGNWYHGDSVQGWRQNGVADAWYMAVYETVHIISSRKTTEYKDYPMPESFPDFPSKDHMFKYLNDYCDHFGIRSHIRFGCRVAKIRRADDGQGYIVRFADGGEKYYGAVIVATGHHWDMRFAGPYPGQADFTGEVLHSKNYKAPRVLEDKRVLVIGGGNSACDVAVEAGRFATESHLSVRRGYWFMPRTFAGVPMVELLSPFFPVWLQRLVLPAMLRLVVGPYKNYGLPEPDHKLWEHHPTINSELLQFIKLGRIMPHPDIKRFVGGKTVEFVDGSRHEFDLIVHCTGYHVSFPIVDDNLIDWTPVQPDGYRYPDLLEGIVPPNARNFFVFGVGQPRYGAGPLITAGAESMAALLKVQAQLKYPVGQTLRKIGMRPMRSYLQDPLQVFNGALAPVHLLPLVERVMVATGYLKEKPVLVGQAAGAVRERDHPQ